ncbi:MAG: polymer-forming cytoskeletal protein [Hyphomicrobiaceae bacterium]
MASGSFFPGASSGVPANAVVPAVASSGTSVIGRDVSISGDKINVVCQSRLQVDGEILGDLAGREIIIGDSGRVTGSISADTVDVRGKVDGSIKGGTVSLHPSARVNGDIVHQTLAISEGAHFDGRVRRAKDASEVKPDLTPGKAAAPGE